MKKQTFLLLAIALMAVPASMCLAYYDTPITISGWVAAKGSFDAAAIYYPGTPLEDYYSGSGAFSETGSSAWSGSGGSMSRHTASLTKNNLSMENSSETSGNAYMQGRDYQGLWNGQAYISSTHLNVSVLDFNPARNPPGFMLGQARIDCSTYFSGHRWNATDSATATMTGTIAGQTPSSNATLLIGPGGDIKIGDHVAMQIIFQSGELGYGSWDLKIGGTSIAPAYHFSGGSTSSERFQTEITLTVGTPYYFSYETAQSYSIHVIGGDGQADNYSCGLQLNIPEPATMLLLTSGYLLLKKRK